MNPEGVILVLYVLPIWLLCAFLLLQRKPPLDLSDEWPDISPEERAKLDAIMAAREAHVHHHMQRIVPFPKGKAS